MNTETTSARTPADYGWALLGAPIASSILIWAWVANLTFLQGPGSKLLLIVVLTIIGTAALSGMEASRLEMGMGNPPKSVWTATGWCVALLLLWAVFYPAYLYTRKTYGLANLLLPGLVVMLVFLFTSTFFSYQIETQSPLRRLQEFLGPPVTQSYSTDVPALAPTTQAPVTELRPTEPTSGSGSANTTGEIKFDTRTYCRKVGDAVGGSNEVELACRQQEAAASAAIEKMSIPDRTKTYCTTVAQAIGGSYVVFKSCVEGELKAAGSLGTAP